ncbi:unnamed protein product [Calypogeia fissa]
MEDAQRQQFFRNLLQALGPLSEEEKRSQGTFAVCEGIKPSQGFVMRSLHVDGAGELQLPLSEEDTLKLRRVCEQAPFGRGTATLVDPNVRRCWQVDASKMSFPGAPTFLSDTIQQLAVRAVSALGIDGSRIQVEAHLYKLLLYEAGGHFTEHRDTERERGMFATLILQLPTADGYTGGQLVVRHLNEVKNFDSQMISALGFCYTVFFADCLHQLQKIESGTRLCLVFNLIRRDSSTEPIQRGFIARRVQKAEAALEPWRRAATEGRVNFLGAKLAFALQNKYTKAHLSFAGLKGDDSVLAEVLKNCRDPNSQKWLDLHLCLVTKYVRGSASSPDHYSRRYSDYYDEDEDGSDNESGDDKGDPHIVDEIIDENIEIKKWVGVDDRPPSVTWIKNVEIDFEKEVVVEELYEDCPFDESPDKSEYTGDMGNYGCELDYWYHKALLVVWPKALIISILCELGVSQALDNLESRLRVPIPNARGQLQQIVDYCSRKPLEVWERGGNSNKDSVTPRLLRLCIRIGMQGDVLQIFELLAKVLTSYRLDLYRIGVRNADVAIAIADAVRNFGWGFLAAPILDLEKTLALTQGESFAELAKQLINLRNMIGGRLVSSTLFQIYEAHIAQLESRMPPEPVFTWSQPRARLPEYPDIERFLRGPTQTFMHTGFQRIAEARDFCENYCKTTKANYSVIGSPGGQGPKSFLEIRKTRRFYEADLENWRKKQEELKRCKLELEKLRSMVPQPPTPAAVSTLPLAPGSGQQDRGRRRSGEGNKKTTETAVTSPKVFIDLTVNTLPDHSQRKRTKSTTSTEVIDLTSDIDENQRG